MTIQGAIYELNNMLSSNDIPCYWKPAIKKIIETVEQNVREMSEQTDGDLISRTDLLKDIADLKKSPWFNDGKNIEDLFRHNSYVARKEAIQIVEDLCIKKLPTIPQTDTIKGLDGTVYLQDSDKQGFSPQIDTASWVAIDDEPCEDWECSNCGYILYGMEEPYRFCPNCGSKMKGE